MINMLQTNTGNVQVIKQKILPCTKEYLYQCVDGQCFVEIQFRKCFCRMGLGLHNFLDVEPWISYVEKPMVLDRTPDYSTRLSSGR
ncbi:hypothetical protein TNIN_279311 [Trichonephila inaurata madagascariensis]|uniref:Uncharacterized protein n=1 Tax=Trichonephila inaurata madagascariensis TaxID=2747483 RepID=A0A8X6YB82_9ARAC|nr:hypothetical protein TNIN_279311 [Trichonephila inaurata madagascariensis]